MPTHKRRSLKHHNMYLLNFGHPISPEHLDDLWTRFEVAVQQVVPIPVHWREDASFVKQAAAAMDEAGLDNHRLQTGSVLVNLPGHSAIAAVLLAELHGRIGHFPAVIRWQAAHDGAVSVYQIAEILNLNQIRHEARQQRGRS